MAYNARSKSVVKGIYIHGLFHFSSLESVRSRKVQTDPNLPYIKINILGHQQLLPTLVSKTNFMCMLSSIFKKEGLDAFTSKTGTSPLKTVSIIIVECIY